MARVAVTALVLGFLAGRAGAKEKDIQHHEVDGQLDLNIVRGGNEAIFDGQYTLTPAGIDRNDDIPPILRRFLLHPAAIIADIRHDGGTREAITTFQAGGEIFPFDALVYVRAEGGLGRHVILYDDPNEKEYWFWTGYAEVGFRPIELIQIGAFYRGNSIRASDPSEYSATEAHRSGTEQSFGGTVTFATPNDRILSTLSLYGIADDWNFPDGGFPGDVTVRGFGTTAKVAYQITTNVSIQLHGMAERTHWIDGRANESTHFIQPIENLVLDRQVWTAELGADGLFWYNGRYAFRLSVGGGYEQAPPLVNYKSTARIQFGGGILLRF